ncbi:hypothetical protein DE146DRAFT_649648 [Phaeosphaeria sp. MPI-PUGE-AT-0046c]|nr:hypothetical protein DE146DRAFT_649648 [Phaeosphaeria sp. MPI-PUGE-AT-0046c]
MQMQQHAGPDSAKAVAPIAQVLNDTASFQTSTDSSLATQNTSAAPFSGKLVDLLLDVPEQLLIQERRRADNQYEEPSRMNSDSAVIKLPQPLQRPAKTVERARIPPLLQGLHQPPPLPPSDRLFPPITDGASGFEQDIRDRIKSANASQDVRTKRKRADGMSKTGEPSDFNTCHIENDREDQEIIISSAPALGPEQDTVLSTNDNDRELGDVVKAAKGRKRKKWSDEETRDLLLGVSRFGIGKWKRILKCPDYKFEGRTAVDLKDRFRVCCPGEGLKARPPKKKAEEARNSPTIQGDSGAAHTSMGSVDDVSHMELTMSGGASVRLAEHTQGASHSKLLELGIHTPFAPSTRRPRRGFSAEDDENLLKGYEKYGAAWRSIRADESLGFNTRQTTDLRDRFRIRFPDIFARAGYKTKSGGNTKVHTKSDGDGITSSQEESHTSTPVPNKVHDAQMISAVTIDSETAMHSPESASRPKPPSFNRPPIDSNPAYISDHIPIDRDEVLIPDNSVVLNRNILQWADANTILMATPSTHPHGANQAPNDTSMHISFPHDSLHINPLATLNLPMMTYTGPTNLPGTAFPTYVSASSSNLLTVTNPTLTSVSRVGFPVDSAMTQNQWQHQHQQASRVASSDVLLRTPNLPTIVFPHVPAASARTMVHNLPAPADLLSGMDWEGAEGQAQLESGHEIRQG